MIASEFDSTKLEMLVEPELIKLHPQKVLTNKLVNTYIKKNLGVGQSGETTKVSGATASELQSTVDGPQAIFKKPEKVAMGKPKKKKNKVVPMEKKQKVAVQQPVDAGSQAAPAKSTSETSSDADLRPLVVLKKHHGAKRKQVGEQVKYTASGPEGHVGTTPENEGRVYDVDHVEQEESSNQIEKEATTNAGDIVVRSGPEQPAQQSMMFTGKEQCQLVLKSAWEDVSDRMATFDEWVHFRTTARIKDVFSFDILTKIEEQCLFWAETEQVSELFKRRSLILYKLYEMEEQAAARKPAQQDEQIEDITFMKHDFNTYKRAFYEKMDTVSANIASSQTSLETSLVRQFTEHQLQIDSDLDFVELQLAELVNHLRKLVMPKRGNEDKSVDQEEDQAVARAIKRGKDQASIKRENGFDQGGFS
ncbi:hypothetical protein F511_40904 [Dorcoceras hygrometricum]|uniref:Uncharacterized protein n=1 Tax=Dorcoceras hygrometricum TaxID=472368 RepID=A0A2Z7D673_9LAMI|nr:hypothetical protein F511_40904 [Dorcoceras hygrometricum]